MINYEKLEFGKLINGCDGSHYENDCFNYGSINGCDEDCPALNNLECDVWELNIDFINDDLIKIYKQKNQNVI